MPVLISAVIFLAMLAALFDLITRDDSQVRGLPKLVWLLLIVFIPAAGAILWFLAGREPKTSPAHPNQRIVRIPRAQTPPPPGPAPLTTEEQLAALEREIAEQEELERIRELEAEIEKRKKKKKSSD